MAVVNKNVVKERTVACDICGKVIPNAVPSKGSAVDVCPEHIAEVVALIQRMRAHDVSNKDRQAQAISIVLRNCAKQLSYKPRAVRNQSKPQPQPAPAEMAEAV